jgi:hypothetical protein
LLQPHVSSVTESVSVNPVSCSASAPPILYSLNEQGLPYSPPALGNSESVNETLAAHCLIKYSMSSCLFATSNLCCIPSQIIQNASRCNHKCSIEILESCIGCTSTNHPKGTAIYDSSCTEPMSLTLDYFITRYFKNMSPFRLWTSPIWRFVVSAAFALLEQCKIFSACGVSLKLLFLQVVFRVQLLSVTLHRHLHLKHDYAAISHRTRLHMYRKLMLCYYIFSCCLILKFVVWTCILSLHGTSLPSS